MTVYAGHNRRVGAFIFQPFGTLRVGLVLWKQNRPTAYPLGNRLDGPAKPEGEGSLAGLRADRDVTVQQNFPPTPWTRFLFGICNRTPKLISRRKAGVAVWRASKKQNFRFAQDDNLERRFRLSRAPRAFLLLWLTRAVWRRRRSTSATGGDRWRGRR
jgi:hypothetical protein